MKKNNSRLLKKVIQKEQEGIFNRYIREQTGWKPHLENCKKAIIEHTAGLQARSIAILGSGWLLDVPVEFFLQKFEKIFLVDITHPKQIKKKYAKENKILFIEQDITQLWHLLPSAKQNLWSVLNSSKTDFNKLEFKEAEIIISLNIFSQLAEIPFDYILKGCETQKNEIKHFFQKKHFELLEHFEKWILISDCQEIRKSNTHTQKINLCLFPIPHEFFVKKWEWNFEHSQLYIKGINEVKKIVYFYSNL